MESQILSQFLSDYEVLWSVQAWALGDDGYINPADADAGETGGVGATVAAPVSPATATTYQTTSGVNGPPWGRVYRRITFEWTGDEVYKGVTLAVEEIVHDGVEESYRTELAEGIINVCTQYYCYPDPARLMGISLAFSTMADAGAPLRVRALYFGTTTA